MCTGAGMTSRPATSTAVPSIESPEHQSLILARKEAECLAHLQAGLQADGEAGVCPGKWDGILCWGRTLAGQLSAQPCPAYIAGFHQQAFASRRCLGNGTWYVNSVVGSEWTNYTQCYSGSEATVLIHFPGSTNDSLIGYYLSSLKTISQVGYGVSMVSLVLAFFILATIKKLRCPRNMLHLHLFVSFIMRAFMALLKDSLFVMGVGLSSDILVKNDESYFNSEEEENWECKLITSLWQYFIMANYSWLLMEGLYLHNLIFLALFSDTSAITLYVALGWGLPTLFVLPWAICRAMLDNTLCWTTNENTLLFLLIRVPTTASIVINFVLFVNIVRVLLLKLRSSVCEETRTYRRWAKSTLVLVPLFGVHYMVFLGLSYSMGGDQTVELAWLFCDQLFASFQGFFVAVLYCFMNGEVRTELAKKWSYISNSRDGFANGMLGSGRFLAKGRGQTRASCYSSTSFTSVSVVPNSSCCINKKRALAGQVITEKSPVELPPVKCYNKTSDENACITQDRRWSKSDYNMIDSMELQSIASYKVRP